MQQLLGEVFAPNQKTLKESFDEEDADGAPTSILDNSASVEKLREFEAAAIKTQKVLGSLIKEMQKFYEDPANADAIDFVKQKDKTFHRKIGWYPGDITAIRLAKVAALIIKFREEEKARKAMF